MTPQPSPTSKKENPTSKEQLSATLQENLQRTKQGLEDIVTEFKTDLPQLVDKILQDLTLQNIETLKNRISQTLIPQYNRLFTALQNYLPESVVNKLNHDHLAISIMQIQLLALQATDLAKKLDENKEEVKRRLKEIKEISISLGSTLLLDLLEILKSVEIIHPTEVLTHSITVAQRPAEYQKIPVEAQIDEQAKRALIAAPPGQLSRLFINLLTNAFKSVLEAKGREEDKESKKERKVIVKARLDIGRQRVIIEIEDQGVGMEKLLNTLMDNQELVALGEFIDYELVIVAKERGRRLFEQGRGMGTDIIRQALSTIHAKVVVQNPAHREQEGTLIRISFPLLGIAKEESGEKK